jgi:signal transduction histidine kinase
MLINYYDRLDDRKRLEKLHVVDQQIDRLTKLMDDVLLLGRGEQRGLTFSPAETDLVSLVNNVIEEVQITYQNGRIVNLVTGEACRHAFVDKHLFLHIFQNLLTNAFKYSSPQSNITIALKCSENETALLVKDEGIGMPLEFQKDLFKMFHRAKNEEEEYQGTGLGLAIVKRAVDSHGGTIKIDSVENQGTSVKVTLPKKLS